MYQLTQNEYIWEVYHQSDDGFTIGRGYFSSQIKAAEFQMKHKYTGLRQVTLYKDEDNNYYYVPYITKVYINLPEKADVLKKLTDAEKRAIGLI